MVDLAFVLRSTDALNAGFQNLDMPLDGTCPSFNHTRLNTVIGKPIAISIETKASSTAASDEGLVQLSIWAKAHFAKLRELCRASGSGAPKDIELPPLLMLLVNGAKWNVLFATQTNNDSFRLWRSPTDFSTSEKRGVYQVVMVLQMAIRWGREQYMEWWMRHALPLTQAEKVWYNVPLAGG